MSERVYCGRCEHYLEGFSDRHWERCDKAVPPGGFTHTYLRAEQIPAPLPSEKNANNDCGDYALRKPAWWIEPQ